VPRNERQTVSIRTSA